ncbi:hypothetical protein [Novosphingobium profundi]|uniref:hypothetical protein n=1 Tax=Novosphingobium profundi TaxID=1774954 RepID=UPI001CFD54FF|nr:hypothetical protein [Novosphingobium profundi]
MTSRDPMRVLAFGTLSIALAAVPLPALAVDAASRGVHMATPLPEAVREAPGQAALMAPPRGRPSHGGGNRPNAGRPNHNRPSHNRPSHGHRPPARGSSHVTINHYENNSHHGGHHHHDHWDSWDDHWHPVRTAATVAVTAAVVGSIVRSVPPNCSTVIVNGISYSQCGNTWYQPQYAGSSVQYVVVNPPR